MLVLAGVLAPLAVLPAQAQTTVNVDIHDPRDGATISEPRDVLLMEGRAHAQGRDAPAFDIAILIDTSGSTRAPAGVDINGNGIVGTKSNTRLVISIFGVVQDTLSDPGDNVLAAEVLAAQKLISQLDPRSTRIALISFSGDYLPGTGHAGNQTFLANPATPDAYLEQPLTNNFRIARVALNQIKRDGPHGGTNIASGIRLAIQELTGLARSGSTPRPRAQKVILLLTDGIPTFPVGSATISDPEDIRAAVSSATVAGRFGIKVHSFALGREALSEPYTVKEVARVTGGRFTPVEDPADIITVLPSIKLIDLDRVQVTNLTTGQRALRVKLGADGSFRALVPVRDGPNKLSAVAYATDGARDQRSVTINFTKLPSRESTTLDLARKSDLDLDLERAHTEKLQLELEKLKKENLGLELERSKRLDEERARLEEELAGREKERQRLAEEAKLARQREDALESIKEAERLENEEWAEEERRRRERLELDLKVKDRDGAAN
jgi:hypothetical protein